MRGCLAAFILITGLGFAVGVVFWWHEYNTTFPPLFDQLERVDGRVARVEEVCQAARYGPICDLGITLQGRPAPLRHLSRNDPERRELKASLTQGSLVRLLVVKPDAPRTRFDNDVWQIEKGGIVLVSYEEMSGGLTSPRITTAVLGVFFGVAASIFLAAGIGLATGHDRWLF